jgi:hypothetical protein
VNELSTLRENPQAEAVRAGEAVVLDDRLVVPQHCRKCRRSPARAFAHP